MISLSEYLSEVFRDTSKYPWYRYKIIEEGDALETFFDGNVPKEYANRFVMGESLSEIMQEHLRNIDSKYIIKDIKEYFKSCYDIIEKDDEIMLKSNKPLNNDRDFTKLLEIYQYFIKKHFKHFNGVVDIELEKNYPEDVTNEIDKEGDRILFHITSNEGVESIMKNGLRPGIHYANPRNVSKQLWKIYKESHDKNKFKKTYMYYIDNFSLDNEGINKAKEYSKSIAKELGKTENYVLLMIQLPNFIRVYKDKSMPMKNCCFTYAKIPSKHIKRLN